MAKLKKPKFHLVWPPGSELSDDMVELWIGSLTVDEYHEGLRLGAMASKVNGISDAAVEADDRINQLFCERLTKWNLEDDEGAELPISMDTIKALPNRTVSIFIREWFKNMTSLPKEPSENSNGTRQLAEQSLGMGA